MSEPVSVEVPQPRSPGLQQMSRDECVAPLDPLARKGPSGQQFPAFANRIRHVIPSGEFLRIFWTVPQEYPEVMHPCRCEENVVVAILPDSELLGEGIKSGLMAKLVSRRRLLANVGNDTLAPG